MPGCRIWSVRNMLNDGAGQLCLSLDAPGSPTSGMLAIGQKIGVLAASWLRICTQETKVTAGTLCFEELPSIQMKIK